MIESLEYKNEGKESDIQIEDALTDKDRTYLPVFFREIGDNNLAPRYEHDPYTLRLRRQLRQEGDTAAQYLLEKIEKHDASRHRSDQLWYDLSWLYLCASQKHAQKVGELLLKDSIGFESGNRSNKIVTFEILKRIAVPDRRCGKVLYEQRRRFCKRDAEDYYYFSRESCQNSISGNF